MKLSDVRLRCGKQEIVFPLPPQVNWQVLTRQRSSHDIGLPGELLGREILHSLEESRPQWGAGAENARVVLVLPDETRPFPWEATLSTILDSLDRLAIRRGHLRLLVATGSHRTQGDAHSRLQRRAPDDLRVCLHDAAATHQPVGETPAGTVVELDPVYVEADLRITAGEVAFHYFAGFGGGPKMVFPGLASREGIRANHRRTLGNLPPGGLARGCAPGILYGNPVAEDIADAVSLCPPEIAIHLIRDEAELRFSLGHPGFAEARTTLFSRGAVGRRAAFDVVVASAGGAPRDIDLVQSHKALNHASRYVRPGGSILMVAETPGGLGSESVARWLEISDLAALEQRARSDYDLNAQTAISLRTLQRRFHIGWFGSKIADKLCRIGIAVLREERIEDAWKSFVSSSRRRREFRDGAVILAATELVPAVIPPGLPDSRPERSSDSGK